MAPSRPLAACALALALLASPQAAAYLDEGAELDDVGAHTLRAGEVKVGWDVVAIGLAGRAQIGTSWALDVLGALNLYARATAWRSQRLALGAELGVLWFDPAKLGQDQTLSLRVWPARLTTSIRLTDTLALHGRLSVLFARLRGAADDLAVRLYYHLGPLRVPTLDTTAELRVTSLLVFLLHMRLPLAGGTLDVALDEDVRDPPKAGRTWQLDASMLLSWQSFHLRLGIGYGASFLGPARPFPVADLYWRF